MKRLSNRWMGRVGFSLQQRARSLRVGCRACYDTNGNPTPTVNEPLVDGGQFAPQSSGSGSGTIYINANWQFNANGMYQAPLGIEVERQRVRPAGLSVPALPPGTALRRRLALPVLVTPTIDTSATTTCGTPTSARRGRSRPQTITLRVVLDVFNVFNANTALVRDNDITSTTFNQIAQNLSPRIFRVGIWWWDSKLNEGLHHGGHGGHDHAGTADPPCPLCPPWWRVLRSSEFWRSRRTGSPTR